MDDIIELCEEETRLGSDPTFPLLVNNHSFYSSGYDMPAAKRGDSR